MTPKLVVGAIAASASLVAAYFWISAAYVEIPANQDTFIEALQRIGELSGDGAMAGGVAAIFGAVLFGLEARSGRR